MMHFYDLDLSLQYLEAGYSVYVMSTDFHHLIKEVGKEVDTRRSSRSNAEYLSRIGGDDDAYFERATESFRSKWRSFLPVCRGRRDESYAFLRPGELREELTALGRHTDELRAHIVKLEEETVLVEREIESAQAYVSKLEKDIGDQEKEEARLRALLEKMPEGP
jgi:uncharacterized coiled-coil DUF342 family protein